MQYEAHLCRLALTDLPGTAAFIVDSSLRYRVAQGSGLRLGGWSAEDFVGRSTDEVHGPEGEQIRRDFQAALAGETFEREHTVRGRRFLTRGGPVRDELGTVVAAVAISADITQKWRSEQLARAQEETLRDIAAGHSAERCIATLGRHAALLRPGLRIAALIADRERQRFERVVSPQLGEGFTQALIGTAIGPEPIGTCGWAVHHARVFDCPDLESNSRWSPGWRALCGSLGIRAVRSVPVIDAHGHAIASFMMAFDSAAQIGAFEDTLSEFACHALRVLLERESAQRAALERVAEGARQFERLADASPAMIWTFDTSGMTTYASKAWYDYTGMQPGEALGVGWLDAVHPEDCVGAFASIAKNLQTGAGLRLEFRMRHLSDTAFRWVQADVRASRDEHGAPSGYIGAIADIDEVRRAHQLLAEEDRRKDEFLATLAHELRNPLAPIGNGLALLRRRVVDGIDQQSVQMMERQFRQLVRLVDDLLDTSRIKNGRLRLTMERVELAEVIQLAIESVRPKIEARQQRLEFDPAQPAAWVQGDRVRLAQIFSNLLDNAAKYTPEGGQLRITTMVTDQGVEIEVADNGAGISPDSQPGVFDIFDRAGHHERGHKTDGLGVGLYLVRSLVHLHGGSVELRSEGHGTGTTVSVRFPRAAGPDRAERVNRPAGDGGEEPLRAGSDGASIVARGDAEEQPQVLIVDDNRDAAHSLGSLFDALGCRSIVCFDAETALSQSSSLHPDLVVLDIGMPGMDGFELARRLRGMPHLRDVTLVALSGWGQAEDRRRSHQAGIDLHWVKPVGLQAIHDVLGALQDRKRSAAARPR